MAETTATTVSQRYTWKRLRLFTSGTLKTIIKRTFGFLMKDGFVYFAIVDEVFKRASVLAFLDHLKDDNKRKPIRRIRDEASLGVSVLAMFKTSLSEDVTECSDSSSAAATYVSRRGRSGGSQSIERKWRRQVQIVLAIDAAILLNATWCFWLAICQGNARS